MTRSLYRALVWMLLPAAVITLLWRGWRDRGYWHDFGQRFGFGATLARDSIWVHAVSVGEVQAAAAMVRVLRERHPQLPLVLTVTTATGAARARALFGGAIDVRFLPFDTTGSVRRFLDRVRPRIAIIVEKELWPNLLHECDVRGVPVVLASAVLSARSLSRYRRLGVFFRGALGQSVFVAAQTAADAARFGELGASAARIHVIGNLKFDLAVPAGIAEAGAALRARLGWQQRFVLVAGSTYALEEAALLEAQRRLRAAGRDLALVLAPRHPPRFAVVADELRAKQVSFSMRSTLAAPTGVDVLLLDTLGELLAAYAMADLAFVGGSLVEHIGGHNLIEPAALAVPTITGPHGYNAVDIVAALRAAGALTIVDDTDSLVRAVADLEGDCDERRRRGELGQRFVVDNRGALTRLLALLEPLILREPRSPPASR